MLPIMTRNLDHKQLLPRFAKTTGAWLAVWCFAVPILMSGAAAAAGKSKKSDAPWWNKSWSSRTEVLIDTGKEGFEISEEIGPVPVLFRLVEGAFSYANAAEDGSDIRFVSGDGKTVLPSHIEHFDPMYGEGFAWVALEKLEPRSAKRLWLYSGSANTSEAPPVEALKRFSQDTVLVYHFNDKGAPPADASGHNNNASNAPAPVNGALIGSGARYTGSNPTIIPNSESLEWREGQEFTFSAWIKPFSNAPRAVLLRRADGGSAVVVGLDNGVPFVSLIRDGAVTTTAAGEPVPTAAWHHIGLSAGPDGVVLYVNGNEYSRLPGQLPALTAQFELGGPTAQGAAGFSGEMDEVVFINGARPPGWFKFVYANQGGSEAAGRLVRFGEPETAGGGANETLEHVMLFGDIARNMMFDGWIAVGVCILMMIAGWSVAVRKTIYIGKIEKGNAAFLREWQKVSSDLTVLDAGEDGRPPEVFRHLDRKTLSLIKNSPLYHIYHIGSEEIRHRLGSGGDRGQGLSARSLQAIRAALDASMVREQHRMTGGLVFLTISIAGGPYVGLLGTVVGVMITFALIAKTGDVEVNSIAPGIASALLATTVGLLVAIPALFIYSFLNSRIKQISSNMQLFIDEFVAKVAEFYPPPGEAGPRVSRNGSGEESQSKPFAEKTETLPPARREAVNAPQAAVSPVPESAEGTAAAGVTGREKSPQALLAAALAEITSEVSSTEKARGASRASSIEKGPAPGKPIEKLPPPRPRAEDDEDDDEEDDYDDDEIEEGSDGPADRKGGRR